MCSYKKNVAITCTITQICNPVKHGNVQEKVNIQRIPQQKTPQFKNSSILHPWEKKYSVHWLGIGLLQQGAPELVPLGGLGEDQLVVEGRDAVVDDDVDPVAITPELKVTKRRSGGRNGTADRILKGGGAIEFKTSFAGFKQGNGKRSFV